MVTKKWKNKAVKAAYEYTGDYINGIEDYKKSLKADIKFRVKNLFPEKMSEPQLKMYVVYISILELIDTVEPIDI